MSGSFRRLSIIAVVGGAVVVVVAYLLPPRERVTAGRIGPTAVGTRPECPHDVTVSLRKMPVDLLSGATSDVPEFHDCQRFLGAPDDTAGYGPLVGIYVSAALDTVQWPDPKLDSVLWTEHRVPWAVPAGWGLPVAMVISWEGEAYDRLGIKGMYQCLYLLSPTQAVMHPAAEGALSLCRDPLPPGPTGGVPLTVTHHPLPDSPPPVGRWDHDGAGQFISLACPGGWCEIGPAGVGQSITHAAPDGVTPAQASRYAVKPWYDEQRLAVPRDPGASGLPVAPGQAVGTLIPAADLGTLSPTGQMVQVGWLAVSHPSDTYRKKLGVDDRSVGPEMASVFVCEGDAAACGVPGDPADPSSVAGDLACGFGWWAKIRTPSRGSLGRLLDRVLGIPTQYHCVIYRDHGEMGDKIPATMRWRWRRDDDGIWTRCKSGCCELT